MSKRHDEHDGLLAELTSCGEEARQYLEDQLLYANDMWHKKAVRAELMHKRTAEHLRGERKRRKRAEARVKSLKSNERDMLGCETLDTVASTPRHYRGDGFVTCARALSSSTSQKTVVPVSVMAFYWWACAFKYVWRMWSKADPVADGNKAIDCIRKALKDYDEGPQKVASYDWGNDG